MSKTQQKATAINLISNVFSTFVSVLIGFFLSPYIVKHLGTEANGYTNLANNFVTYATLITTALNSMAARFVAVEYHRGNFDEARKYYSSVFLGNIVIIAILLIPSVFIIGYLESLIKIDARHMNDVKILFSLVFANFFISLFVSVLNISAYVKNKLYYLNIYRIFGCILNSLILVAMFGFFEPKMFYVSIAGFVVTAVSLPVTIVIKKRIMPDITFNIKEFNIKYIIELISSGIWNTVNQCGNILMTGLDLLLANLFINPVEMGLLSIAKTVPTYIIQLGTMVNSSFSPSLTITYASDDKEAVLKNLRSAMKISSILMSIPIVVFVAFGEDFYSLWMPTVDSKKLVMLSFLSCMAFVPLAGTQVLYNVYTTTNKLKLNSITVILGGVLNFVIVYILLKTTDLGVVAIAGVSSLISLARNLLVTIPYAAVILKLKWYEFYKDVGITCLCSLVTYIISYLIKTVIYCETWIFLIISVGIAAILSLAVDVIVLLDKEEKQILKSRFFKKGAENG